MQCDYLNYTYTYISKSWIASGDVVHRGSSLIVIQTNLTLASPSYLPNPPPSISSSFSLMLYHSAKWKMLVTNNDIDTVDCYYLLCTKVVPSKLVPLRHNWIVSTKSLIDFKRSFTYIFPLYSRCVGDCVVPRQSEWINWTGTLWPTDI